MRHLNLSAWAVANPAIVLFLMVTSVAACAERLRLRLLGLP